MLDKKIKKYLETPENKLPLGAKFVISIPDSEGTNEFLNCVAMLEEIKRDNPDYIITLCEECSECGAVNDTVSEVEVDGEKVKLCDFCIGNVGVVV
jgi:hypothetical protein